MRVASFTKYYYYQLNVYKFTQDFTLFFLKYVSSYLFIKEMNNTIIIVFIKYYGCSSTPQHLRLFVFQISLGSCSSSVSMNNEML